ncbi:MAG: peptidoglycan DD-metalloendopeptidase family protein [Gammaproteobacteria bacterium]|nr:peptidoglycan DD-metalloendopeptidase family protein [Gammaproteobacteria bacterium]
MKLVLFTTANGRKARLRLGAGAVAAIFGCMVAVAVSASWFAFKYGQDTRRPYSEEWRKELAHYRLQLQTSEDQARTEVNALASRLGQLQAQVIRLNALGDRLVTDAGLDQGEFDFSRPPGLGGPGPVASDNDQISADDFMSDMDRLSEELRTRETQLSVLESLYRNRELEQDAAPVGRPVRQGWISSYFGKRVDPFTGREAFHEGLDIAGKPGSDVVAIADGVVTWSGWRYGYGRMVEVKHGNGYVTRYGHNQRNLVQAGDVVHRGQTLALMGSSGRSTGPHVHLEVLKNDRHINPLQFVLRRRHYEQTQ